MTLPRYRALKDHWQRFPRPEWLIAAYMGFKPREEAKIIQRGASSPAPRRAVPPPSGALMTLFNSLGGKPGKTVVLSA